MADVGGGCG